MNRVNYKIYIIVFIILGLTSQLFSQDLKINELMSSNQSTLIDEDGDYPDWIELHNSGVTSINLQGYGLSDDSNNLMKWQFPAISMAPQEYLLNVTLTPSQD